MYRRSSKPRTCCLNSDQFATGSGMRLELAPGAPRRSVAVPWKPRSVTHDTVRVSPSSFQFVSAKFDMVTPGYWLAIFGQSTGSPLPQSIGTRGTRGRENVGVFEGATTL